MNLKRLIIPENANPLPNPVLASLFFVLLIDSMTLTMVFSFLPKLVKSFGISEVNTGYYAGIIASTLFVGRALFSLLWGYIADVKGKKVILTISTTLLMFSTLAFGFTETFYFAVITRFMQGGSSALISISKSILSDICDDTNLGLAMSILFSSTSIGLIIGPSVAGFLVFPAEQYPSQFHEDSFFGRFGIMLPNFILTICFLISIIFIVIYVPKSSRSNDEKKPLLQSSSNKSYDHEVIERDVNNEEKQNAINSAFSILEESKVNSTRARCSSTGKKKKSKLRRLLSIKECVHTSILYGFYSLAATSTEELFPLFAATITKYNGMGFSTSKIGLTLLMLAVLVLPTQLLFIPKITQRYGSRKVFIGSGLIMAFLLPWIPIMSGISSNRTVVWVGIVVVLFLQRICLTFGFVNISILLNNSVEPDLLGSVNGFGMTLSAVGGFIGPAALGTMYSWSLTNINDVDTNIHPIGFPFNQYFTFFILSIFFVANSVYAFQLSPLLDKKKIVLVNQNVASAVCVHSSSEV